MPADHADRDQAEDVGEQDEHEQREYVRRILAAFGADIGGHHVVDKAGKAFDHELPAAGHQLALHAALHEHPDRDQRQQHPQGAVGEGDGLASKLEPTIEDGRDLELVHRVDFA